MTNYASIVPLIGGPTIAMEHVFGKPPEYILSYTDFEAHDSQLLNYYDNTIPYYKLDTGQLAPHSVDIVNTVCPCAGLSSLSPSSNANSSTNDWMVKSAEYILESVRPTVFWGENAPRLASKMGEPVVSQLRELARKNGYTFSMYKTKSLLHGLSQVRDRAFYFFWKGNSIPVFDYYKRAHEKIEDTIRGAATNEDDPMSQILTNSKTPSKEPFYQYVLEEMHGGISHMEFFNTIEKTTNPLHYIEDKGVDYADVAEWMDKNGHENHARKCRRMGEKLKAGGNIMRKTTEIGKNYIGAFVGHFPLELTHPDYDRYLTVREVLSIMKMPKDFQLVGGRKNINMVCQNVPVTTATDMAMNVKKFIDGKAKLVESEFAIQCNKTESFWSEKKPSTLEAFI